MSRLKAYEIMKLISYLSKGYRAGVKDTERNVLPSGTTASRPQRRMDLTSRVNGTGRAVCRARHVRDVRRHHTNSAGHDLVVFFFLPRGQQDSEEVNGLPKILALCQRGGPDCRAA